jgi:NTE family protein
LFASGLSAAEIRELATSAFGDEDSPFFEKLISEQATHWLELVEIEVGNGGLLDSQRILSHFYQSLDTSRFSDLDIPLDIVAGDLWDKQQKCNWKENSRPCWLRKTETGRQAGLFGPIPAWAVPV